METIKNWNKALLFTGQGIQPEDVTKYASKLREVDEELLETNIDAAERITWLPIAPFLVDAREIFGNNAALQVIVHTLNVTAGDLANRKMATTEGVVGAGHSLGEAGVMDAAGVFPSRADSMDFVFNRGRFMHRDNYFGPGHLYRIDGLTEEQVDDLALELEIAPSLINTPKLILVGSSIGRVDLEEPLKVAGATKVENTKLPAFHTLYMVEAQKDLESFSRSRKYRTANFPVFSNYDGSPYQDGYDLVASHITSVTNRVRWADTIANINHPDVTFYVLGPGSNMAALNRLNGVPKEQTKDLFQLLAE